LAVRVLVVDDHPATRAGLVSYLSGNAEVKVVGEASNAQEALRLLGSSEVDVVLLDVRMPQVDGIELMEIMRRELPRERRPRVLVVSSYSEPAYVLSALRSGASGYLLKTVGPEELIDAVLLVSRGKTVFSDEVVEALNLRDEMAEELTPRELEVLKLTARGYSAREIAGRLYLSERTVQGHLASAYEKLGVNSRTKAIAKALKLGLLRAEDLTEEG